MAPSATLKAVLNACAKNDATNARQALGRWVSSEFPGQHLGQWLADQGSEDLTNAVNDLDRALYASGNHKEWNGAALTSALKALPPGSSLAGNSGSALPALYLSQ